MVISQRKSNRKPTGGRYKEYRKKKSNEQGGLPMLTKLADNKAKIVTTLGGNKKSKLLNANTVNLLDKKTGKYSKTKIKVIMETPSNRNYARRNVMTKGTVIETEKGKAVIVSRPGQEGQLNAVLI
ncbi:MAG: 30S ribosomal protein S8e [Candidatus Woesearchaeota archaeon]